MSLLSRLRSFASFHLAPFPFIYILRDPVSYSLLHSSSLSLPSRANDFSHQSSLVIKVSCAYFSPAPHLPSPPPPSAFPSAIPAISPYQPTPSSLPTAAHLLSHRTSHSLLLPPLFDAITVHKSRELTPFCFSLRFPLARWMSGAGAARAPFRTTGI
ncbi:hypothetical protein C8J57DRAFT_1528474 [Mycena rebaudengoi]|nr:hypothetical protein C8J57DRAFT_1528474 [Mycena rebaudengoi]